MKLDDIKREFAVRYYYWAVEDFKREITDGFPYLRHFKSGSPYWVASIMSGLTSDEKLQLAKALVKRFHKNAAEIAGDPVTREEIEMISKYREHRDNIANQLEVALYERQKAGERVVYANRKRLAKLVMSELRRINLNDATEEDRGWSYITEINGWEIKTYIDTGHRHAQLLYNHQIYSADKVEAVVSKYGEPTQLRLSLAKNISLNSWLGINSETCWFDLTDEDSPVAAVNLAKMCSHFLQTVPILLKALEYRN